MHTGVRPTRAEIDLGAVVANATAIARHVGENVGILGVVKADAYGHGAVPVARALHDSGVTVGLAVSLVEEGLELRRAGITGPIVVMGAVYAGAHREVLALELTPVVSNVADIEPFARAAAALGVHAGIHVKIDSGMARLGVAPAALAGFVERCHRYPSVEIAGVCTHLASADTDPAYTRLQLERFDQARRALGGEGVLVHAANSAGVIGHPAAWYDAVRPGLALYGGGDPANILGLAPVMRFVTSIVQLRDLAAGDAVSYGGLWQAPGRARIATLPVGYADGYPRRLTGRAEVLIHGRRCPVVGAVCMDMTMVDVTALGDAVAPGDEAVLLGAQGDERITVAELAARAGLVEYEITCGVSKRVPRVVRPVRAGATSGPPAGGGAP